jgi:hypothetical protein
MFSANLSEVNPPLTVGESDQVEVEMENVKNNEAFLTNLETPRPKVLIKNVSEHFSIIMWGYGIGGGAFLNFLSQITVAGVLFVG